jgi:tetratricopeptide (TPR) repeat protein
MPTHAVQLHPPRDEQVFEDLCRDLFRAHWGTAQLYGRRGHEQKGIDLYGKVGDEHVAVQCKKREGKLAEADVGKDVESARRHEPPFQRLVFATTAPRDPKLQDFVRGLPAPFAVEVWFWDDLERELARHDDVFRVWEPALGSAAPLVDVGRLPSSLLERLVGREREVERLDAAWADRSIRVLSVVALGGAGKTALVHHWMQRFEQAGWKAKGAAAAFAWSFYSQGGGDARQASGDFFISEALRFFGDRDPVAGLPRDRGVRLAQHLRRRRTLLVLDGLEPLQEPPSSAEPGKVKDPAVAALILQLAADNPGLLVLTTREPVAELKSREENGAPRLDLDRLGDEAGAALLRWLEVKGTEAERRQVAHEVHGHALTLTLLGTYLRDAREGDVRAWKDLSLLAVADLIGNRHAARVMSAYSDWFGSGPERQILSVVGLFDRPAAAGLVEHLRREPAIPGVTDEMVGLSPPRWNLALTRLRRARLLLEGDDSGALDAHPLVREHFGRQLETQDPAAWKAAHSRLFDHLKDTTEPRPDTLEGLQPLYQAVAHGCRAGRQQEACVEVYRDRILRGTEPDGFYSTRKLGAIGADLGAVASFFEPPWSSVSPALTEAGQAWLLSEAASRLSALGRLPEAVAPMRAGLEMAVEQADSKNAAIRAGNLSELELTLGDVAGAVRDAERSVDFADRSGDGFQRMGKRTTLADALHQAGRRDEALALFGEAETTQAEQQPQYPQLYSLPGFRYCDLLLASAERAAGGGKEVRGAGEACDEVEQRAGQVFAWRRLPRWNPAADPLLDIALDHLTLGRARLYRALLVGSAPDAAKPEIDQAVADLRRAGRQDHLPRGLLTRAWLRSSLGDPDTTARADLDEAEEIAERGPMPLFLADVHLHRARLFHDRAALAEARRLVEKHGYGRRREELADLEAMAGGW